MYNDTAQLYEQTSEQICPWFDTTALDSNLGFLDWPIASLRSKYRNTDIMQLKQVKLYSTAFQQQNTIGI